MKADAAAKLSPLVGLPYLDGGTDPETGVSCWGLVRLAAKHALGVDLPSTYGDALSTECDCGELDATTVAVSREGDSLDVVGRCPKCDAPARLASGHAVELLSPDAEAEFGDVVELLGDPVELGGRHALHVGFALSNSRLLHATPDTKSRVDRLDVMRRAGRIVRIARFAR